MTCFNRLLAAVLLMLSSLSALAGPADLRALAHQYYE
jgi:hypothetical protein